MADRRGRKGSIEDLIPADRRRWAQEIWADRAAVAGIEGGAWLLRTAAEELGIDQEEVDRVLGSARSKVRGVRSS